MAGNFKSNIADYQELKEVRYNKLLSNVLRGVDTYWLSEPIRIGFNPVSYTHLDVYKRQSLYGNCFPDGNLDTSLIRMQAFGPMSLTNC